MDAGEGEPFGMPMGPSLIFDMSLFESLTLYEAVMIDDFYMSTIRHTEGIAVNEM